MPEAPHTLLSLLHCTRGLEDATALTSLAIPQTVASQSFAGFEYLAFAKK
jgi:hypothetical protein